MDTKTLRLLALAAGAAVVIGWYLITPERPADADELDELDEDQGDDVDDVPDELEAEEPAP